MRRLILVIIIVISLALPVSAMDLTAPTVPEAGEEYMPENTESFSEGLWTILKDAISALKPELAAACRVCLQLCCAAVLLSLLQSFSGMTERVAKVVTALMLGTILLRSTGTLIDLAADTVQTISEYGKLLLPVMSAALAAQGCTASSAALYSGTALFGSILSKLISSILIPMVYIFLALAVAGSAMGEEALKKLKDLTNRLAAWCLKTMLSVFTGFLAITGVVGGTTDAAALKLTRAAISGMVPVVGGILSDASESVLVGAGLIKNAAGIYGMLAAAAVCIGPFLEIGVQYLLLKATAGFCDMFGGKQISELIQDFSAGLGLLLGMTGACTLLLMISTICFMKGVG